MQENTAIPNESQKPYDQRRYHSLLAFHESLQEVFEHAQELYAVDTIGLIGYLLSERYSEVDRTYYHVEVYKGAHHYQAFSQAKMIARFDIPQLTRILEFLPEAGFLNWLVN